MKSLFSYFLLSFAQADFIPDHFFWTQTFEIARTYSSIRSTDYVKGEYIQFNFKFITPKRAFKAELFHLKGKIQIFLFFRGLVCIGANSNHFQKFSLNSHFLEKGLKVDNNFYEKQIDFQIKVLYQKTADWKKEVFQRYVTVFGENDYHLLKYFHNSDHLKTVNDSVYYPFCKP